MEAAPVTGTTASGAPVAEKRYVAVLDKGALEIARAAVDSWRYTQRHLRPFHLRNREDDQVRAYLALANARESDASHREQLEATLGHIQSVAGRFMRRGHAGFEYEGISDELALTLQELSLIHRTAADALRLPR